MTHSIDSFITDSANSATALYTGKKSSVNALNVYADSVSQLSNYVFQNLKSLSMQSANSFDDPKVETIAELFRRKTGGPVGMVSTAFITDATPGWCFYTRQALFGN